jgi:S-adenosylmethionine:tRNA ribosyltransferase-isomerase
MVRRDKSKLLVYKNKKIIHSQFENISDFLPENSFLFFNDTRVIPARIHFRKETGADIEIFLLAPIEPSPVVSEVMQATMQCVWKCTIGNLKRWTAGTVLSKKTENFTLEASLLNKEEGVVQFSWSGKLSFAEIVNAAGETPLPPYLKRKAEEADRERYQTIYSHYEGAVAAPTAGLHFTATSFKALEKKNIAHDFLTLHVSAGTFQPVKAENAEEHIMHHEQIIVTKKNIDNLLVPGKFIISVGTTSMRTLESLYWFGVKLLSNPDSQFIIEQTDPYRSQTFLPSSRVAIEAVKNYMDNLKEDTIAGKTSIFIKPGYKFRICNGLITNFHQPASTLILLIAAFIGEDWKKIYDEAIQNNYRFLSFGDSSLLIP